MKKLESDAQIKMLVIDLIPILQKLVKDNFLTSELRNVSYNGVIYQNINHYFISWEGSFHNANGGYSAQRDRLQQLEENQRQQAAALLRLNIIIAVGTAIAAVYYIIEIFKPLCVPPK